MSIQEVDALLEKNIIIKKLSTSSHLGIALLDEIFN